MSLSLSLLATHPCSSRLPSLFSRSFSLEPPFRSDSTCSVTHPIVWGVSVHTVFRGRFGKDTNEMCANNTRRDIRRAIKMHKSYKVEREVSRTYRDLVCVFFIILNPERVTPAIFACNIVKLVVLGIFCFLMNYIYLQSCRPVVAKKLTISLNLANNVKQR